MPFKTLYVLSFLIFFIKVGYSQTYNKIDSLRIHQINQAKGLSQISINAITQDDLEYLWIATQEGLNRFNGQGFKIYYDNPLDSLSILDDHNLDLNYIKDTLFISSMSKGIFGLKLSTNSFFQISKKIHQSKTYKSFILSEKYVLFSISDALQLYNRKTKKMKTLSLQNKEISEYIRSISQISTTTYLLGTNKGLYLFNIEKHFLQKLKSVDNTRHSAIYNFNNTIFLGTDLGLYTYNLSQQKGQHILKNHIITSLYKKDNERLWVGSNHGLIELHITTGNTTKHQLINENNKTYDQIIINTIKGDKKGNVWIGTQREGLFHFNENRQKFTTLKLKISGYPKSKKISSLQFLPYKDSTLFIGSSYNIFKYNFKDKTLKHYNNFKKAIIKSLIKDTANTIWSGGFYTGLLKYDSTNDIFVNIKPNEQTITASIIENITELNINTLLLSTRFNGIFKYDINKNEFSPFLVNGKQINRSRASLIDSKGNLWLGSDEGLFKIDKQEKVTQITSEDTLSKRLTSNRLFSLKEDTKGVIWIGTNSGITRLDTKTNTTTLYYKQKGLPNDFIYALLIDKHDNIWVSTNKGISTLNTISNTFTNYSQSDGLQNDEFNSNSAHKDRFGNFYFGGIDGFNIFNPDSISKNKYLPKVYIESVDLFNSPINKNELFKDKIEFKSHENVITFNYAALNFLNPQKVTYSYFLEGFDKTWRPVTKKKSTTYTNLEPGNYAFRVKATNNEGVWSTYTDEIKIIITPPWYKTFWFKILSACVVILILISFYLYKIFRLKKEKQKLTAIVTKRTKELIEKNKDLKLAVEEAKTKEKNISFLMRELKHRVKNNLQIISSLLNIQSNHMKDQAAVNALKVAKNRIVTIAYLENIMESSKDTIVIKKFIYNLCENILRVLADENQMRFEVIYDLSNEQVHNLNSSIVGLIINELITNTCKYAFDVYDEKNILKIKCSIDNNQITLIVQDNGKGYEFDKVSENTLGINLVKEMVNQLNGKITVQSNTSGTQNTIIIPIKKEENA